MGTPIINGTLTPVEQPYQVRYDPVRGFQIVRRYQGANSAQLLAKASEFNGSRWQTETTVGGAFSELVATASSADGTYPGAQEVTTDTWQILANELQKHIFEHGTALGLEASVNGALAQVMRNYLMITGDSTKQFSDATWTKPTVSSGDLTNSQSFLGLLMRGTTHFSTTQYVLRHTTNVSQTYAANISDSHINQIYTTAQLLTEVQDGSLWVYPLPGRLAYKINAIAAPTSRTGYTWGWRKLASSETTSAGNRIEITTEYWLEQWNTGTLYSTYS